MKKRVDKKRLGDLLVEKGQVTDGQLEMALAEQQKNGGLLGEILIGWGYTTEEGIVQALSSQYEYPYVEASKFEVSEEVVELVPKEIASRFSVVGLDRIGNTLSVAMSNPMHEEAIASVEKASKCKVQVFITTYTEIMRTIERHYQVQKPGST